jgi:uncharacterized protein
MRKILSLCALTLIIQQECIAVSFDCRKASNQAEKMVCSSTDLSKQDDLLHGQYNRLISASDEKEALIIKDRQRAWLKERNKCKFIECLQSAYLKRSEELALLQNAGVFYYASNEQNKVLNTVLLLKFPMLKQLLTREKPESEDWTSWEYSLKIREVNDHYFVIREDTYLFMEGAPHPDFMEEYLIVERPTGRVLGNGEWLTGYFSAEDQPLIRSAYLRHFGGGKRADGGCGDLDEDDFIEVSNTIPSQSGLGLIRDTAHVDQACAEPFFLSWKEATPFLNPDGIKLMRKFQR